MIMTKAMKVLSDPVRCSILEKLKYGKKTAGEISDEFNLTKATLSYHLKILKENDFVVETKYKNFIYYELNITVFEEILKWILKMKGNINEKN